MAYIADNPQLISPPVLQALTNSARRLTDAEQAALKTELDTDPEQVGYKDDAGKWKDLLTVVGLLNTTGRAQAVAGNVILEAGDVLTAYAHALPVASAQSAQPATQDAVETSKSQGN